MQTKILRWGGRVGSFTATSFCSLSSRVESGKTLSVRASTLFDSKHERGRDASDRAAPHMKCTSSTTGREERDEMELFIFARFHARAGHESAAADALLDVLAPTRGEPGCLSIHAFRSSRDPQLFYIHSRWKDEAAFERHAGLPHTIRFVARVEPLIDHPLDLTRAERIG